MMELQDFVNFLEFAKKQMAVLKEKEEKYKDNSWKLYEEEDHIDAILDQVDKLELLGDDDIKDKQRRALHVANIAFFIYDNLTRE